MRTSSLLETITELSSINPETIIITATSTPTPHISLTSSGALAQTTNNMNDAIAAQQGGGTIGTPDNGDAQATRTVKDMELFEDRLRRLEATHSLQDAGDNTSSLVCTASKDLYRQIDLLGTGYNELDEVIAQVEKADQQKGIRISALEQRIVALESSRAAFQEDLRELKEADTPERLMELVKSVSSHSELATMQSMMECNTTRIEQLESKSGNSLSSFSAHDIAQELIRRLGNGDSLSPIIQAQLQSSLAPSAGQPIATTRFLMTPATTVATNTRQSTFDGTSEEDQPRKRPLGRPPKRGREFSTPSCNRNSSTSKRSSPSDNSDESPPTKRPRGRPITHGRYSKKLRNSSSSSEGSKPEVGSGPRIVRDARIAINSEDIDYPIQADKTSDATTEATDASFAATSMEIDTTETAEYEINETSEESIMIPPERRSARTPKVTKQQDGFLSWKKANVRLQGLKPEAPKKKGE
ncbi:hypothetical protein LTR37_010715 [Vermiconidia calcicola]|uniref:Uncharacterized protein n=1 Tax=Vermiconidia calcicola TaxID=1690605 RepID=A0ACC3N4N7_9PEZI|nr:hypothetical protein LTR37_010715 [Vermiconidia calcicola]